VLLAGRKLGLLANFLRGQGDNFPVAPDVRRQFQPSVLVNDIFNRLFKCHLRALRKKCTWYPCFFSWRVTLK
jgi:hypothetical protein